MDNEHLKRLIRKELADITRSVNKKSWQCFEDGCCEKAINSHLLMRNGILNRVAENGKLIEFKPRAIEAMQKGQVPLYFKEVGINQAISYPLFCNSHDTSLFKEIEGGGVDYSKYRHIVLYCYRAICAEIRKKDIEAEKYKRCFESPVLEQMLSERSKFELNFQMFTLLQGKRELEYYRDLLKNDLNTLEENFVFASFELPMSGLYASTISSLFSTEEETYNMDTPLNAFFFHLIPQKNSSRIILGYHKKHYKKEFVSYIDAWKNVEQNRIGYKLTGLLLHTEGWGMRPSLYKAISQKNMDAFIEMYMDPFLLIEQMPVEAMNLFEGIV